MKNPFGYSQFDARVIIGSLTREEAEVTECIVHGDTYADIMREFGWSRQRTQDVIAVIRRKFGVNQMHQIGRIWFCGIMDCFDPE